MTDGRMRELAIIAKQVRACHRCPGLNVPGVTQAAPGYGDPQAPVFIIGQSLCYQCMETQIPFTGGSGFLLDKAFQLAGVQKKQIFITNVIHCHPPSNRPSQLSEIGNCSEYLLRELEIVQPRLVISLGKDAKEWLCRWKPSPLSLWNAELPVVPTDQPTFLLVPHPAYIMRQMHEQKQNLYIQHLANAIKWAFKF